VDARHKAGHDDRGSAATPRVSNHDATESCFHFALSNEGIDLVQ
jgi:hypothetical protein